MGVADSWAVVKGDMEGHGVNFFVDFFAAHPEYQNKFGKLKGKSGAALKSDGAMKAQAMAVMKAIDACVSAGSNKGKLAGPLGAIASTHVGYGVTSAYFQDAFSAFVVYLGKAGVSADGWDAAIATIMEVLTAELKKNGGS